ncbi:hypothetical protein LCGC14_0877760 [marine sediment metagenome]|uniref:DUF2341 domain-containing protein n=1 Tax=marine sediment metagenome TaxID=412755 RepID=A0A0F9RMG0_9ZZZZ
MKRFLRLTITAFLLVAFALPLVPPQQVLAAGWLANYDYRKEITITGTTEGAVTDYAMKLRVFKEGKLVSYSGSDESIAQYRPYEIGLAFGSGDYDYEVYAGNPVVEAGPEAYDIRMAKDSWIISIDDKFVMYYTGHDAADVHSINVAESYDGVNWIKYDSNPIMEKQGAGWEALGVARASVYDTEAVGANRYRMLYMAAGAGPVWQIGYAFSADGYAWTRGGANPVIPTGVGWESEHTGAPSPIVKIGSTYYVYYEGYSYPRWKIGLVTFTDFEGVYTKHGSNPVFTPRTLATQYLDDTLPIATTTVTVLDTSVFEVGEPVWLRDVSTNNLMFNRVDSITDATHLELEDVADQEYETDDVIRSWMYRSVAYMDVRYENETWKMTYTAFESTGTVDRRVTGYATSDDGINWDVDFVNSPPIPYDLDGGGWDDRHVSDPRIFQGDFANKVFLNGILQDDFDDIRFTKTDGTTELDFWVETNSVVSGVTATIWVEFDSIAASPGTETFYIYWGNNAAVDASDGDATFDFFDDFPGAAIDGAKWDLVNAPTVVVAGSTVTVTNPGAAAYKAIRSDNTFDKYGRLRYEGSLKSGVTSANAKNAIALGTLGSLGAPIVAQLWGLGGGDIFRAGSVGLYDDHAYADGDDALHVVQADWVAANVYWYIDEFLVETNDNDIPAVDLNVEAIVNKTTAPSEAVLDWIFYDEDIVIPEPAWTTWGATESTYATVVTYLATELASTSVKFNGEITDTGTTNVVERGFEYGLTTAYGNDWTEGGVFAAEPYDHIITGLDNDTTYHYRAMARNTSGWAYGEDKVFSTTDVDIPSATTTAIITYSSETATLPGTLDSLGAYSPVYVSFEYGETTAYLDGPTADQTETAPGAITADVTGLTPNTLYHYRIRVRYDGSYVYGADETFTTNALGAPTLTTGSAVGISNTGATIQGTLTSLGDYSPVYVYFEYGLTAGYGASGSPTSDQTKTSTGGLNAAISGLSPDTLYHYRMVVRYGAALTVNGADATFTTTTSGEPGVDDPDDLRIDDVKIFTNYLEPGDMLVVLAFRIVYDSGKPVLDIGEYFDNQLLDATTVKAQLPVTSWGYRPGSIYLNADSAPAWSGSYRVKIIGTPDKWGVPPETYRDITAGDYQSSLTQLDSWVILLAESIESFEQSLNEYYPDLVVTAPGGARALTSEGGGMFNTGIPGLSTVRPNIFSAVTGWLIPGAPAVHDTTPSKEAMTTENMGDYIEGLLSGAADFLEMETTTLGGFVFGGAYIIIACIMGAMLGGALVGMGLASPVLIMGAWFGLVSPALLMVIAMIFVFFIVKAIWLGST